MSVLVTGSGNNARQGQHRLSQRPADIPAGTQLAEPTVAYRVNKATGMRCVLIVDDDDSVRETLADILDLEGFCTLQAADVPSALALLGQHVVDALVTDLSMPGEDGIALIRRARTINRHLPAILLTGYAEEAAAVSTIAGGQFHVLRKPVEAQHLINQISLLVSGRSET